MSDQEEGELSPGSSPEAKKLKTQEKIVPRSDNIIWVDLEMTGLDLKTDHIMEMACIVTDRDLNILEEGPNLVIHMEDSVLEGMGEWCTEMHGKTGLTAACRESVLTCAEVEDQMLKFIKKYCVKGKCELAGNSIHCDRAFLVKEMPRFVEWLHHRIIDVSTIQNLGWRWYGKNFENYKSEDPMVAHRALDDIHHSIKQLRFFRQTIFRSPAQYQRGLEWLEQDRKATPPLDYHDLLRSMETSYSDRKRARSQSDKLESDKSQNGSSETKLTLFGSDSDNSEVREEASTSPAPFQAE